MRLRSNNAVRARWGVVAVLAWQFAAAPTFAAETLDAVQRFVAASPAQPTRIAIAAHLETEGHWGLANRGGDRFTAAGATELRSGLAALIRDAPGRTATAPATTALPLDIYVSAATVFGQPKALAALPANATLYVVANGTARRMTLQPSPRIELSPLVTIEADGRAAFDDATWHLTRPLEHAHVRVLAIEADGPSLLSAQPRLDAATGKPLIDAIAPRALMGALSNLRGQSAVVTGQITDDALVARGRNGGAATVSVAALMAAADAADISLIMLHAGNPAQPGGRNWLWQTVAVAGLAAAPGTLGDALSMMGGGGAAQVIARHDVTRGRLLLQVRPAITESSVLDIAKWSKAMGDWAQSLTGKTPATLMTASLPTAARQQELDRRWIKRVPSIMQWGYLALLALGLLGAAVAWQWWTRVWPSETPADYTGTIGFQAARAVRGLIFVTLFLPLVAPVSAAVQLSRLVSRSS
jgi:hypothetical protein